MDRIIYTDTYTASEKEKMLADLDCASPSVKVFVSLALLFAHRHSSSLIITETTDSVSRQNFIFRWAHSAAV